MDFVPTVEEATPVPPVTPIATPVVPNVTMNRPKKLGGVGVTIVGVLAVLILVGGVGVGVKLAQEGNKKTKANTEPVRVIESQVTPTVVPGSVKYFVQQAESAPQTLAPWKYSEDAISPVPPRLSLAQYDTVYKRVRKAIEARDWATFKTLASADKIWNIENPKDLVGETRDGRGVFKLTDPKGEVNFRRMAPFMLTYWAPEAQFVLPEGMVEAVDMEKLEAVMVDPDNGRATVISTTPWAYMVNVTYKILEGSIRTGTGQVSFVYDRDHWAYKGEKWEIYRANYTPKTAPALAHVVKADDFGLCSPRELTIKRTETVVWKKIIGMVRSVSAVNADPWNSLGLLGEDFEKKFEKPGEYKYVISKPPQTSGEAECSLIVK